ncbi:MDIS1-interacting receptor like kinase 2-like isoform X2 [Salvia splendens]|uniref:MDIS1-interacting receptor like kinase 2-like isoform X2 n=1 Tax=Salvia splendens TaxID=180675 RepID=UPI001C275AA6|nr:MDIS1-interacting receptor like kinase 2-like isoform X2 [Salvia splendens]
MNVVFVANAIIITVSICSLLINNVAASNSSRELKALMDFGWPYINSTAHHCHMEGITCDDHGRVAELSLQTVVGCDDEFQCHDVGYLDPLVFTSLTSIHLTECGLYGAIPPNIGYLSNLSYLNFSNNLLNSQLPLSLANLSELLVLDISYNYGIYGLIPPDIGSLSKLTHLYLSFNNINGSLPSTMSQLTRLEILKLDGNRLEGVFEAGIHMLPSIKTIGLRECSIGGRIPSQLGNVANAKFLNINLSTNHLIGEVPISISSLEGIDLSYNNLEGEIPANVWRKFGIESFQGNTNLHPPKESRIQEKRDNSKLILAVVMVFVCVFLFTLFFGVFLLRKKAVVAATPDLGHGNIFKIWNFDGNMAYQDIIEATQDFDLRYCIGTGAYGSVYRAVLPTRKVVAVKKLHSFEGDNPTFDSSFRNEAKLLSQIRHRNIVKLLGFCMHQRSMFLIYDYMERGSLFSVLKDDDEAVELNWKKRLNVVKGIANALSYMHHDCSPPILHRDISSKNILLDSEFEGCLSDFGTARLLDPDSSNQTLPVGTRGYIAPVGCRVGLHNGCYRKM